MQKINLLLIIATLLSFTFISCDKKAEITPTADTTTTTTASSNGTTVAGNEVDSKKLLDLVNQLRKDGCTCGTTVMPPVSALVLNSKLEQASYGHANDMHTLKYFSHDSQDGRKFTDRIKAAGYTYTTAGENIASGYSNEQSVFNGWKGSEGHCKNMMNGNFTEAGFGRKGNYWVQVFAKPK